MAGRGQLQDSRLPRKPAGPAWVAFRRQLFASWGIAPSCWACGHPVHGPDAGEVQHVISWRVRPDLAWTRSNLRPVHGGGRKRCGDCGLACNTVAASLPAQGEPVPWSAQFIAAARARTEQGRQRSATGRDRRQGAAKPPQPPRTAARPEIDAEAGRAW